MSHARLMFDGTVSELRQRFGNEHRSLESMYLALTETNGGGAELDATAKHHALADRAEAGQTPR
jgi:hypothetical protein